MRVKYFAFKISTPLFFILNGGVYLVPKNKTIWSRVIFKIFIYLYLFTRLLNSLNIIGNKSLNYHSPLSHNFVNYDIIKFEKVLELF